MEKKLLINDTYQVLKENKVLFQGTSYQCDNYIDVIVFLNGLKKDPEFTRRLNNMVEKITGL
jgi:hypothetical protein